MKTKKKYKNLRDAPKNEVQKQEFDNFYEEYKEMFKTDPLFIGVICRKLFGNDKKKRFRFGDYAMDRTVLDLYKESRENNNKGLENSIIS